MLRGHEHRGTPSGCCRQRRQRQLTAMCVELCHGLVEDQVARPHGQQAGQGHELLLAAGEPARVTARQIVDGELLQRLPRCGP